MRFTNEEIVSMELEIDHILESGPNSTRIMNLFSSLIDNRRDETRLDSFETAATIDSLLSVAQFAKDYDSLLMIKALEKIKELIPKIQ